jgi:hypothetical protein
MAVMGEHVSLQIIYSARFLREIISISHPTRTSTPWTTTPNNVRRVVAAGFVVDVTVLQHCASPVLHWLMGSELIYRRSVGDNEWKDREMEATHVGLGGAALTVVQAATGVTAARIRAEAIAAKAVLENIFGLWEMIVVQRLVGLRKLQMELRRFYRFYNVWTADAVWTTDLEFSVEWEGIIACSSPARQASSESKGEQSAQARG